METQLPMEGEGEGGQRRERAAWKNEGKLGPAEQCCQAPRSIVMKMAVHMTTMATE